MNTFKFSISGKNVDDGQIRAKDASLFLRALNTINSEASLALNSMETSDLRIKATNKGSFEFLLEILQLTIESNQLNLSFNDIIPTASIAQSLGFLGTDNLLGLIDLIKLLQGKPIKKENVRIENNKDSIIITGDNHAPITVHRNTIHLYNSDGVRKSLNDLVQPMLDNPGYSSLSFGDVDKKEPPTSISREEAQYFVYEEQEEEILESTIRTKIKVVKSVYEGRGQWTIKLENNTVNAKIINDKWLHKFQTNQIDLPPRSVVEVTLKKYAFIKGGHYTKPPKFEVIDVHDIQRPPKQENLI